MSSFKNHSDECSKAILEGGNKSTKLEDSYNQTESVIYKESAWGWVVVLASSYCFGIVVGMINNYALIYDQLIKEFSTTQHNVFFSGSAFFCILFFFAIVCYQNLIYFSLDWFDGQWNTVFDVHIWKHTS